MSAVSPNNRIAKNTVFLYARMILVLIVGLYTTRVVLNLLGASDFGLYNVVAGFVSLFSFLNASFSTSIQRFYNFEGGRFGDDGFTRVFSVGFRVHAFLAAIVFIILETFGLWYINNIMVVPEGRLFDANIVFQLSVCSLVFVIIQIPYLGAIIAKERLDFFALVSVIEVILRLGLIIILPYAPYNKLILFAIIQLLITLICFVFYFVYAKHNIESLHLSRPIDKSLMKEMLSFSGWTLVGSFAFIFKGQGVNIVLNSFFGTVVNAARGIAFQVNNAVTSFATNIGMSFRPQVVESYAIGNYSRTYNLFLIQSKVCFGFVLMIITPLIFEMDYVLRIWLGDSVPEQTSVFTSLVLIDALVNTLAYPVTQVVFATGHIKRYQLSTALINIVLVPLCCLFLWLGYDAWIAFLLTIIVSIICQIVCLIIMRNVFQYSFKDYIKTIIFPCALISVLLPIPLYCLHGVIYSPLFRLLLECLASVLISVLLMFVIVLSKAEKEMAKDYVSNILKRARK